MTNLHVLGTGAPGTYFQVNSDESIRAALPRTSDQALDVGTAAWGPLNTPQDITAGSILQTFGPLRAGASLVEFFTAFFNNYGTRGKGVRVASATASVSSDEILDLLGVATWRIESKHPTEEPIYYTIEKGMLPDTRKLTVWSPTLGFRPQSYDNIKVSFTPEEQAALDAGTSKFMTIQQVNQLSKLITIVDLDSASAAPDNLPALTNEEGTITITGNATGGDITPKVTIDGVSRTATVAYNATGAQLQTALRALDIVGNNVDVTGGAGGPYTYKFRDRLANKLIAVSATHALTGGVAPGVTVQQTKAGGAATLADGDNGFTGVTDATYIGAIIDGVKTGLQAFNDPDLGKGQVALYGVTTLAGRNAIIEHCEAYGRFGLPDLPFGLSHNDVIALRRELDTSHAALYFPTDVEVYDYAGSGVKKLMCTSPFIAGVFAYAEQQEGIGRAPANFKIPDAIRVGVTVPGNVPVDKAMQTVLSDNQVNAIRDLPGRARIVYDEWVLKSSGRVLTVHEQRVINHIIHDLRLTYADVDFRILGNSRKLYREVKSVTDRYLESLGADVLVSFFVRCDETNNNSTTRDAEQLYVDITIEIVGAARQIIVRLNSRSDGVNFDLLEQAA